MASIPRDSNRKVALFGVSSTDGTTPTPIKVNPATGAMLISGGGSGATTLDELTDVVISSPENAQILKYDSGTSKWINAANSGGTGISNVVEDTTPQLGGNLDLNTFTVGDADAADLTKLAALTATSTELNYVDGVTSAIQTQLDGKASTLGADDNYVTDAEKTKLANLSGTNSGDVTVTDSAEIDFTLTGQGLTASIVAGSIDETKLDASTNASLDLADSAIQNLAGLSITATATELNYTDGVTSSIQTQLDAKPTISSGAGAPASTPTKVGDIYIDTTGDDAYIAVGTASSSDWEKSNDGTGAGGGVDTANSPNVTEFARFTDADTIEGRTPAEARADLDLEAGTDFYSISATDSAIDADVATHAALTATHGVAGAIVGTTDVQTLTNKTLTSPKINENVAVTSTATELNILDGATLDVTELNYVDGVTSAIQTQLDGKSATSHSHTVDGLTDAVITAVADNEVLAYDNGTSNWINQTASEAGLATATHTHSLTDVTDVTSSASELNILDGATLTVTELNYVDGVTSAIQTQINTKQKTLAGMSKSLTVETPTSSEDISMFFTPVAITITEMRAVLIGSATPSVTWTVRHGSDRSATGTEVVTSGTTTTSTTTGSDVTVFNDATIPADSFVWFETTAQSGTVTQLNLTIVYTED